MPIRLCPECQSEMPLLLEHVKDPRVWYYRCGKCGHVWSVLKDALQTTRDIRERPAKQQQKRVTPPVRRGNDPVLPMRTLQGLAQETIAKSQRTRRRSEELISKAIMLADLVTIQMADCS